MNPTVNPVADQAIAERLIPSLQILKKKQKDKTEVNWVTAIFMGLFHVGAIAALFFFSWKALIVATVLWWVATSLGIGMCYHRLLTHRGYKVPRWLEYTLTVFATLALEGGPIFWVATHRIHHQIFRSGRRPAFARRRHLVVAHGLDPHRQVHASRHHHARALRPRPRRRTNSMSGSPNIITCR